MQRTEAQRRTINEIADTMLRLGEGVTEKTLTLYHRRDDLTQLGDDARELAQRKAERRIAQSRAA